MDSGIIGSCEHLVGDKYTSGCCVGTVDGTRTSQVDRNSSQVQTHVLGCIT